MSAEGQIIPDDIWEAARTLRNAVNWNSNSSVEIIAKALLFEREQLAVPDAIIQEIMEQAQVFASTYSLVGGRFDDGSKMHQSEEEKAELERLIRLAIWSGTKVEG